MTNQNIIEISDLDFAFGRIPILEDINLDVHAGDFIGVVGPNGSGKTTLLRLILGLIQPNSGTIRILGDPPASARKKIGYVPQFASFDRKFPISVLDTVIMGTLAEEKLIGPFSKKSRQAAMSALEKVKADDLRNRQIGKLSGGQLQRVLVARALVTQPQLLLLDEPTSNIDCQAEYDFFAMLHELNRDMTIVMVSHDLGFISSHVNRIACVNRRLVCHPARQITPEILAELYGHSVDIIAHDMHTDTK